MTPDDHLNADPLDDLLVWRETIRAEQRRARAEFPDEASARAGLLNLFFAPAHAMLAAEVDAALAGQSLGVRELVGPAEFIGDLVAFIRARQRLAARGWTAARAEAAIERHQRERAADGELVVAAAVGRELA